MALQYFLNDCDCHSLAIISFKIWERAQLENNGLTVCVYACTCVAHAHVKEGGRMWGAVADAR